MLRLLVFIRPHRLEQVKSAIAAVGVSGMTVSDVRGTGNSPESTQWFPGEAQVIPLPIRSRIEVVVPDDMKDAVVDAILASAQTGDASDGKIFIQPIETAIRVRTGERGEEAL
jgi:nitrogen regulatory protein P-II 1